MDEPFIPHEISHLAVNYTIPFIFIGGLVSIIYNHRILGFLQFCLYASSIFHWKHIKKDGIIRNVDISFVITTFCYATYLATYIIPNIKYVWYKSVSISICVFFFNEYVFYTLYDYCQYKTYMQYQSVIIHAIFLHILPTFTSIYYVINGIPKYN